MNKPPNIAPPYNFQYFIHQTFNSYHQLITFTFNKINNFLRKTKNIRQSNKIFLHRYTFFFSVKGLRYV
ncbi:hypothetical protein ACN68_08720 [Escherichia coli]|nr:hypothetical protein ACN68_08720 [Escherichia coli]